MAGMQMNEGKEFESIHVELHDRSKQEMGEASAPQVHHFYFIKIRPPEKLKAEEAYKLFQTLDQDLSHTYKKIYEQEEKRKQTYSELKWLPGRGHDIPWKRIRIEFLEQALDECCSSRKPKPRTATFLDETDLQQLWFGEKHTVPQIHVQLSRNRYQNRLRTERIGVDYLREAQDEMFSSKNSSRMYNCLHLPQKELNDISKSLKQRIQHGSRNRTRERKLFNEMKHVEATRGMYLAPNTVRSPFAGESKEELQNKINILLNEIEEIKSVRLATNFKAKHIIKKRGNTVRPFRESEAVENEIRSLRKKLHHVSVKRGEANQRAYELRKKVKKQESEYNNYMSVMNDVKEQARKKGVGGLKDLSNKQVENFMSKWNSSKSFRDAFDLNQYGLLQ